MKLYKDQEMKEEIEFIDFGIVPAGQVKKMTIYVYNDTAAFLEKLEFQINHPEVSITEAPSSLKPKGVGKIEVEWKPSVMLKQGLKTLLKVRASELWA